MARQRKRRSSPASSATPPVRLLQAPPERFQRGAEAEMARPVDDDPLEVQRVSSGVLQLAQAGLGGPDSCYESARLDAMTRYRAAANSLTAQQLLLLKLFCIECLSLRAIQEHLRAHETSNPASRRRSWDRSKQLRPALIEALDALTEHYAERRRALARLKRLARDTGTSWSAKGSEGALRRDADHRAGFRKVQTQPPSEHLFAA